MLNSSTYDKVISQFTSYFTSILKNIRLLEIHSYKLKNQKFSLKLKDI